MRRVSGHRQRGPARMRTLRMDDRVSRVCSTVYPVVSAVAVHDADVVQLEPTDRIDLSTCCLRNTRQTC